MGYFEQFIDLLGSPVGAILGAAILVSVPFINSIKWLKWVWLSGLIFSSSLHKFSNEYIAITPSLFSPLEELVQAGRPLTLIGIAFLTIICVIGGRLKVRTAPKALILLLAAQSIIAVKIAFEGDIAFALISVIVNVLLFFVMSRGVANWLYNHFEIEFAFRAIAGVAFSFVVAVALQATIDPSAIAWNGRLHGTTANAQHAAVMLAVTLPSILYLILRNRGTSLRAWISRLGIGTFFLAAVFCLVWTGSRTGMVMAVIALLIVFRALNYFVRTIIAFTIGIAALALLIFEYQYISNVFIEFFLKREDTRTYVWVRQWSTFMEYPIFGEPLTGARPEFAENSWLAMAANTGLIGLLPLLFFGFAIINLLWRLEKTHLNTGRLQKDATVAGLLTLLVGSFAEAYLLGNLTAAIILTQFYIVIGTHLLLPHLRQPRRPPAFIKGVARNAPIKVDNSRAGARGRVSLEMDHFLQNDFG
jgi:hypothetical protein